MEGYLVNPEQVIMAEFLSGISKTPFELKLAAPFKPIPPEFMHNSMVEAGISSMAGLSSFSPLQNHVDESIALPEALPDMSAPLPPPASPTDWSALNQFIANCDVMIESLAPVATLGTQLQEYLAKTKAQLALPEKLLERLGRLEARVEFLHDFLQALQEVKEVNMLSGGLGGELTSIGNLQSEMGQFVEESSTFYSLIRVINIMT